MARRGIVVLLAAILLLAACARQSQAPEPPEAPAWNAGPRGDCSVPAVGTSVHNLEVDGTKRQFIVDVPDGFAGQRLPVVMVTHGLGGKASSAMAYTGFGDYGERYGFIVVAPQAMGDPARWDFLTGPETEGSDFAFIAALRDHVVDSWCGDDDRVFMTGFSNGSAMTFAAACRPELRFAGYGGVAAAGYMPKRCNGAPPASILYAHGTGDPVIPFGGGNSVLKQVQSAPDVMGRWAEHNECTEVGRGRVTTDVTATIWGHCSEDTRLAFYTIDGGGHQWPGGPAIPGLGRSSGTINVTALMTRFFALNGHASG